jgi:drug/metabolite transporter (DMT)-like permease
VLKKILGIVCLICFAIIMIFMIYIKFTHIDMTDTRLFVNYWWECIMCVILGMGGGYLIFNEKN